MLDRCSTCSVPRAICVSLHEVTLAELFVAARHLISVGLSNWVAFQSSFFPALVFCLPQVADPLFALYAMILYARFISICYENKPYFSGSLFKDLYSLFNQRTGILSEIVWRVSFHYNIDMKELTLRQFGSVSLCFSTGGTRTTETWR
jgi:hypothetical protein